MAHIGPAGTKAYNTVSINLKDADEGDTAALQPKPEQPNSSRNVVPLWIRLALLVALAVQATSANLIRKFIKMAGNDGTPVSDASIMFAAEFLKLAVSLGMLWRQAVQRAAEHPHTTAVKQLHDRLAYTLSTIAPMLVPAVVYLVQNLISLVVYGMLDAATVSLLFQLKILSTATCSYVFLGKTFPPVQIRGLFTVLLGVIQIVLSTRPKHVSASATNAAAAAKAADAEHWYWFGVMALMVEVTLSGFNSVYMEKMFKGVNKGGTAARVQVGVWERNVQLSIVSVPIYTFICCVVDGRSLTVDSFFHGWNLWVFLTAGIVGGGGLIVAFTLKYTDAVMKCLATVFSLMLTTFLAYYLLSGPLDEFIVLAAAHVIIGTMNYSFGKG